MESHYLLQHILGRYDAKATPQISELRKMELDSGFVSVLLRMFEDEQYLPEAELNGHSLDTIIDYIRKTHIYYLAKKLPEMEQSIELLLADYSDNHPLLLILRNFYLEYKANLAVHIRDEETHLLPYISFLNANERNPNIGAVILHLTKYSLDEFVRQHSDTEDDLGQVHRTIREYCPPYTNQTPYRILLTQLELEKDLSVHAIIEDKILIPRAMKLEADLIRKTMPRPLMN